LKHEQNYEKHWALPRDEGFQDPLFAEVIGSAENLVSAYNKAKQENLVVSYPKMLCC
jgi:hypothetical protein